jgi:hypothetical protein
MTKIAGSGSISQRHGSADPDPPQNVMDPQHCFPYTVTVLPYPDSPKVILHISGFYVLNFSLIIQ